MSAALAFNEQRVHRDHAGKFAATGFEQRWTDAKGGRAWNVGRSAIPNTGAPPVGGFSLGAKLPGIPVAYTGSRELSADAGSFSALRIDHQVPKAGLEAHNKHFRALVNSAEELRKPITEKATKDGLIPDGAPKALLRRAYNHATLLALHDFHAIDYDFKMDDHLKADLQPLRGFMTYVRRRMVDTYRADFKGKQMPYRAEFGHKFPKAKFDRATGQERLRPRPNQVLIKFIPNLGAAALDGAAAVGRWGMSAARGASAAAGSAASAAGTRVARATEGTVVGRAASGVSQSRFGRSIADTHAKNVTAGNSFGAAEHYGSTLGRAVGAQVAGARGAKVGASIGKAVEYAPEIGGLYAGAQHLFGGKKDKKLGKGLMPDIGANAAAGGQPKPNANPNVLPVQQGVSRWDRYRMAIARNENQGQGDMKQLTFAQKMERVHAAKLGAMKMRTGAQRLQPGQPGSVAHQDVGPRDYGAYAAHSPGMAKRAPIVAAHPAALAMVPEHLRHLIDDPSGADTRERHLASLMPPEVRAMMGEAHAVIARHRHRVPTAETMAASRHATSNAIADRSVPLHSIIRG